MKGDEGQPLMHTQRQTVAHSVGVGQHVLVNTGDHVSLQTACWTVWPAIKQLNAISTA